MIMLHFISINTVKIKMIFRQNDAICFENYNLTPLDNYVQWTIPGPCLFYQSRRKNPLVYKGLSLSKTTFRGQGSRSPDFGAEIRPHSQCQKVCFFPNSRQKNSQFDKKKKKKNFFGVLHLYFI